MVTKDLHVTIRVHNNHLLKRRTKLGYSQRLMAQAVGISLGHYTALEALKRQPYEIHKGIATWTKAATMIAEYLDVPLEELFPASILAVQQPIVSFTSSAEALLALSQASQDYTSPERWIGEEGQREVIDKAVATLPDQLRHTIIKRFGLDDGEEKSRSQVGSDLNVGRERMRQIEEKALRFMRHPRRSLPIKNYLLGEPEPDTNAPTPVVAFVPSELPLPPLAYRLIKIQNRDWVIRAEAEKEAKKQGVPPYLVANRVRRVEMGRYVQIKKTDLEACIREVRLEMKSRPTTPHKRLSPQEVEAALRQQIQDDLSKCTAKQQQRFHDIYYRGVPKEDLYVAWNMIKKTLRANAAASAQDTE